MITSAESAWKGPQEIGKKLKELEIRHDRNCNIVKSGKNNENSLRQEWTDCRADSNENTTTTATTTTTTIDNDNDNSIND